MRRALLSRSFTLKTKRKGPCEDPKDVPLCLVLAGINKNPDPDRVREEPEKLFPQSTKRRNSSLKPAISLWQAGRDFCGDITNYKIHITICPPFHFANKKCIDFYPLEFCPFHLSGRVCKREENYQIFHTLFHLDVCTFYSF